ncbi:MAG: hypothetical protein R3C14_46105 [Caldilineaceae bacterium]
MKGCTPSFSGQLQPQPQHIARGAVEVLLHASVTLSGLDTAVTQRQLNLFQRCIPGMGKLGNSIQALTLDVNGIKITLHL